MRFLKRFLVTVIVIALLGVGFYFVFERPERLSAGDNPLLELFFGDENGGGIIPNSKEFVEKKISSLKRSVEESVQESVKEKQEEVVSSLKGGVNSAIDAAQEKVLSIETVKEGGIKVLQTVKVGTNAYFLISVLNSSGDTDYEVDWGDGSTEKGVLSGGSKTVSHLWSKEGDFSVVFKTSGAASGSEVKVFVTK